MVAKSKLYKTKQVALDQYTTLELAFLLFDLFKELTARRKATGKLISEKNQKTYDLTHEIELEEARTKTEKIARYDKMEEHLKARRLAKQESIIIDEVLDDIKFDHYISKLGGKIKSKQNYFKVNDGDRVVKPSDWKEFYNKHLKNYM